MNYLLTFHTEEGKDLVFLTVTGAQHNGYFSTLQSSHRDIYIYMSGYLCHHAKMLQYNFIYSSPPNPNTWYSLSPTLQV